MRDQYAGDISDLLKYALLAELSADDSHLGVAWYYNPEHDGRNDGIHIEYSQETGWELLGDTWHKMQKFCSEFQINRLKRTVEDIEKLPIWPHKKIFHRIPVPQKKARQIWAKNMIDMVADCDLVFLDPDNGISAKTTKRHATYEEIRGLRREGRTLVMIKFPGRITFDEQEKLYHRELRKYAGAKQILTLRTKVLISRNERRFPRFRWFTIIDYNDKIVKRLNTFSDKLNKINGVSAIIRNDV